MHTTQVSRSVHMQALRDLKGLTDNGAADASTNLDLRHVPDCLRRASELIDAHVNRLAAGSGRPLDALDRSVFDLDLFHRILFLPFHSSPLHSGWSNCNCTFKALDQCAAHIHVHCREGWRASYCFGNLYRDGQDTSGAHADRLTLLGTRPIIASLSLGASRLFRVRKT